MVSINCRELTVDEQLALAGAINEGLGGRVVALLRDDSIVLDQLSGRKPELHEIETIVQKFIDRRKASKYYSLDLEGDDLVVHSPDPLARSRGRKNPGLPDNILKCPACAFVTRSEEALTVHLRSHYAGLH